MAEAVMGPLLGRLQELAMKEARAMVAVNDHVRNLRDKLMWMQAFLRDAEPRRRARNDELTRVCLRQIRDAVFDAEDAVDRYFLQVDLSKYPSWSQTILKVFKEFTTQVRMRRDLSRRILSLNLRLESIIENKNKYQINDEGSSSITTWRQSTILSVAAGNMDRRFVLPLVGRDENEKDLKAALIEKVTKYPMVITVTGKSGVGKTKLVKAIYEQRLTKENFEVRAWISFAPHLSASNIMKLILLRLTQVMRPEDDPSVGLKKELQNKNYLLVLDGEVSSLEWTRILGVLSATAGNYKSRVVRITQQMDPEEPPACFEHTRIELDHLEQDKTTELFLETLLVDKKNEKHNVALDQEMADVKEKYAKSMFEVTSGLPLAVVLLSGLLRTKEYPGEWKNVFEHLKGKSNDQWKRVDIILSMCFDDLPHDLKSCFLYFTTFPVNMLIRARTMVCMWMAEGFLSPREGKTMEKVGHHYLSELIHRRLVNLPPVEYAPPGFERVTVQSRVHDFLLLEAQEASFVEVHNGDDVPTLSTTRRLSLQNHTDKYAALATPLPKLRSIFSNFEKEDQAGSSGMKKENPNGRICFCHGPDRRKANFEDIIRGLLQGSKFLRVISLDGLEIGITLPHEIGSVVHLQYLGVTSCSLQVIPPSVGKLTRLQTLDVRATKVTTLPPEFWNIKALRHVFGLVVLPKRVGYLEQLQNLTTIKPNDTDDCWDRKTFEKMIRLQALCIEEISKKNVHALSAIYKLKYLMLLVLCGEVISSDLFTKSKLPRLQVMRLNGKIEPPLSEEPITLPSVTKLVLKNTKVSQCFINNLGKHLPLLAILTLLEGSCADEHLLAFENRFPSLTELTLEVKLERIKIGKQAFPHLLKLEIFVYSLDLWVDISENPDIKEKIKVDAKYLHATMNPQGVSRRTEEAFEDQPGELHRAQYL